MNKKVSNKQGAGSFESGKNKVEISFALFAYEEGKLKVIYSPALDLFGYGKTEREAEISFEITLEEFLRYTLDKNTLMKELKRLGWKVKGDSQHRKFYQPNLGTLLKDNEQFNEVFNERPFRKYNEKVQLQLQA
jgi:hypothetical protein